MAAQKNVLIMTKVWARFDEAIRWRDREQFQQMLDAWVKATEPGEARQQLTSGGSGLEAQLHKVGGPFSVWGFNALSEAGAMQPRPAATSEESVAPLNMVAALGQMESLDALAEAKDLGRDKEGDLYQLASFFLREEHADGLRRALRGLKILSTGSSTILPLQVLSYRKPTPACFDALIEVLPTTCSWVRAAGPWVGEWAALKSRKATRADAESIAGHVADLLDRLEAHGFDLSNGGRGAEATAAVKRVAAFRQAYPKTSSTLAIAVQPDGKAPPIADGAIVQHKSTTNFDRMQQVAERFTDAIKRRDRALFVATIKEWVDGTEPGDERLGFMRMPAWDPTRRVNEIGGPFGVWGLYLLWEAGMMYPQYAPPRQRDLAGALVELETLEATAHDLTGANDQVSRERETDLGVLLAVFAEAGDIEALHRTLAALKVNAAYGWVHVARVLSYCKPTPQALDILMGTRPKNWMMILGPWLSEWSALKTRKETRADAQEIGRHVEDLINRLKASGVDLNRAGVGREAKAAERLLATFHKAYPRSTLETAAKEAMAEARAQGIDVGGSYERKRM